MPTLNWIGKEAVLNHHRDVPFHLLREVPDLSVGDPGSGNLLVEGDNLLALKALLPYYAGQVKCIYIDPPYNTGNESWVYNDNVNSPEIRAWLGQVVGSKSEDLTRHEKWLCMMYPRLNVLRHFLRKDGVIIVSIDDNELSNLRLVMDEIFGEPNWIATLVWEKTRKNDAKFFSIGHDYMLVYGRDVSHLRDIGTMWREAKLGAAEIMEEYARLRDIYGDNDAVVEEALVTWYKGLDNKHPSKRLSRYKHVDKLGVWRDRDISWPGGGGPRYDVIHPKTNKPCKVPDRGWGFATLEVMQEQIESGLVVFREDHTEPPIRKAYLTPIGPSEEDDEEQEAGLQVMPSVIYRHTQPSVRLLRKIMGGKVFNNPKDHEVLARLIHYITKPGDIVLDSFAGSGSTGHAVLQLNRGNSHPLRFILVEMEQKVAHEITRKRLQRVIEGYQWESGGKPHREIGLGGGFRYCTLGETLFDADGQLRHGVVTFADLARHVFFTETGSPLPADVEAASPLIGVHNHTAIYLLYNGILDDVRPDTGNVLTRALLAALPPHDGPKVIYGNGCLLSPDYLKQHGITFRQTPYEIRVS